MMIRVGRNVMRQCGETAFVSHRPEKVGQLPSNRGAGVIHVFEDRWSRILAEGRKVFPGFFSRWRGVKQRDQIGDLRLEP